MRSERKQRTLQNNSTMSGNRVVSLCWTVAMLSAGGHFWSASADPRPSFGAYRRGEERLMDALRSRRNHVSKKMIVFVVKLSYCGTYESTSFTSEYYVYYQCSYQASAHVRELKVLRRFKPLPNRMKIEIIGCTVLCYSM